jgi:hypothetical protein
MKLHIKDEWNYYDIDTGDFVSELEIMNKFRNHNVLIERIELYKDFTINLIYHLNNTYLGKEFIKTEKDKKGHYNWCFSKVCDEFYDEDLSFYENDELYQYFYEYFNHLLYNQDGEKSIEYFISFWNDIFNYDIRFKNKNKKNFEVLLNLYQIFDKSLNTTERVTSSVMEELI